jgi:hypothetical protein
MRRVRLIVSLACAALLLLSSIPAGAAEEELPPPPGQEQDADGPRRPRRFQRPGVGRPGRPGPDRRPAGPGPRAPFGLEIPQLKTELERHREAMRELIRPDEATREAIRAKIRELVQQGAEREEIAAAVKELVKEKANEKGQAVADELATHHENMAQIFRQADVADAVAKAIVERVSRMVARRRGHGPAGPRGPGGPPRRPRGPRGQDDAPVNPPENF